MRKLKTYNPSDDKNKFDIKKFKQSLYTKHKENVEKRLGNEFIFSPYELETFNRFVPVDELIENNDEIYFGFNSTEIENHINDIEQKKFLNQIWIREYNDKLNKMIQFKREFKNKRK